MGSKKCVVVLATCDAYDDVWFPFFALLDKYWNDCPYDIYIDTETKNYKFKEKSNLTIKVLHPRKPDCKWGARMLDVLAQIDVEYIFLILDDFFLRRRVRQDIFEKCIEILDSNLNIASMQLNAARLEQEGKRHHSESDDLVISEVLESGYKTHCNPTIWRKSVLEKWLRRHESIWGFEAYGSERARRWHYPEKVLSLDSPVVFDYLWVDKCSVILNGKWLESPQVDNFFEKERLNIDFNKRGRITIDEYRNKTMLDVLKKYTFLQKIERIFGRIRSLW